MKVLIAILLTTLLWLGISPKDTTDKSWLNRSGMLIYTDNLTGVQYLKAGMFGGALTPRLKSNGRLMTEKEEME